MKGASRGYSLLELTIALAIVAVLCVFVLRVTTAGMHWLAWQAQRDGDAASVGRLADRWRAEEDSAWAIFTPPTDVLGKSNADDHELDFFTRDGKNRSYFWAYTYDASARTLTRYLYPAPGAAPVADETFPGVTRFVAHTYPLTALQDASTPVYSALYANATLQPGTVRFYPQSAPWIDGGNQITYVRIETASEASEMRLSTQTAPSGFTIVLRYTPAPAATTGPLVTLGKIVFEPASLAYDAPAQRIARGLNALLAGGTAAAQSATCSYAQLFLQDGSADVNNEDGFNATDSQGCVTNGSVRLWARESHYPQTSDFFLSESPTSSCLGLLSATPSAWAPASTQPYAIITPIKGTSGCSFYVSSSDKTLQNGGAASVTSVVNAPPCVSGNICYAALASTSSKYFEKCNGGGAQGPPCPSGGNWFYQDSYSYLQFSSTDGGDTWLDLGAQYDCAKVVYSGGPGAVSCSPQLHVAPIAYNGTSDSTSNLQTNRNTGPTYSWTPSTPPTLP